MRILLISYYFPPCGGAAVQRWLKWLPELVENGFDVTVLTTRDGDYPVVDISLLQDIPSQVKVIRCGAPSVAKLWKLLFGKQSSVPYGDLSTGKDTAWMKKILIWARLNLIIPDARKFWNPSALKAATAFLKRNPIDLVITTGPPHSTHLIGLALKERHRVKWIADWRDPWSSVYYLQLNPPGSLALGRHRRLERKVAETADLNIAVSRHLASQLPASNTEVVYNGYNAGKTKSHIRKEERGAETFRIKYVGNLTEGQKLAEAVQIIRDAFPDGVFELSFVGTRISQEQLQLLEKLIPGKYVCKGFAAYQEALDEMVDCEVLLLLINFYAGFEGMLTTKLFEYMASGSRIFCVGPHGGEAEELILAYEAGGCFDTSEREAAAQYLRSLSSNWRAGGNIKNTRDISELSAQNQAKKLMGLLKGEKND